MDDRPMPEPDDLPEELIHLVKPELQPGERLLWASRAGAPSIDAWPSKAGWIWFFGFASIFVGCFAALPKDVNQRLQGPAFVLGFIGGFAGLIALLFLFIFAVVFASKRAERSKLGRQTYALTDRRAIIWVPSGRSTAVSVHTFQRGTIRGEILHRVQYPDGSGDVLFQNDTNGSSGFYGVAEVRRVEELVRRFLVTPGVPSPSLPTDPDLS